MKKYILFLTIPIIGMLTGCETLFIDQSTDTERMQMIAGMRSLQEENRKLNGRVEALELEMQRMDQSLSSFRIDTSDSLVAGTRGINTRLNEMEGRMNTLVEQQAAQKQEIINTISQKVAALIQSQKTAPPSHSDYVYEYVVKPGDTLSVIAKTYNSSVSKILRENDIKDPNHLEKGQKIYIPAKKP
ncbi:MAG: LysM peptidoglycan-binding domain-containing protein [Spartobacteria bacterium]|nr:LysM peptidoglycan-binding domain-containing protein [Spartobacteria bacterium]